MVSKLDHMEVHENLRDLQRDPASPRVPVAPVEVSVRMSACCSRVRARRARLEEKVACYLPSPEAFGRLLLVWVLRNELVAIDVLVEALAQLAVLVETHGRCCVVVFGAEMLVCEFLDVLSCCVCWVVVLRAVLWEEEERKRGRRGRGLFCPCHLGSWLRLPMTSSRTE